ncbi:hypothetical protein GCM10027456_39440 [Kineosporia babensis]
MKPGKQGAPAAKATEVAARRIRQLRRERGFKSATAFAERCAQLGAPAITDSMIASIETMRRGISLDELLVFALALDVPPAQLLTPPDHTSEDPGTPSVLAVTSTVRIEDPDLARRWIIGDQPLPGTREEVYYAFALEHPTESATTEQALSAQTRAVLRDGAAHLAAQYDAQIEQFTQTMRTQVTDLLDELDHAVAGTPDQIATSIQHLRNRLAPPTA